MENRPGSLTMCENQKARQRRSWLRRRNLLREELGGVCKKCGSRNRLEFHHPHGRAWKPREVNRWTRIARYWRDYFAGNLELRCHSCHMEDHPELAFS